MPNAQGSAGAYRLPEGSEKVVCYVINTAEYCAEITPQLQDIIRNKIDKAYVDSIDLSAAQDNFQDVVATAIRALVLGLQGRLEPALRTLAQTNWGTFEDVGEESEYVRSMNDCVQQYIPAARGARKRPALETRALRAHRRRPRRAGARATLAAVLSAVLPEVCGRVPARLLRDCVLGQTHQRDGHAPAAARLAQPQGLRSSLFRPRRAIPRRARVALVQALMLQLPIVGLDASDPEVQKDVPRLYMKFVTKHMARVEMVRLPTFFSAEARARA